MSATAGQAGLLERLAELRRSFDAAFAVEAKAPPVDLESFLLIGVAGTRFAVRQGEIGGLEKGRALVPLPSRIPELAGLAAIRGRLVPVYGLAELLGLEPAREAGLWLLARDGEDVAALAFSSLEAYIRVPPGDIQHPDDTQTEGHGRGMLRLTDGACAILSIASVLRGVRAKVT